MLLRPATSVSDLNHSVAPSVWLSGVAPIAYRTFSGKAA
jgi:hypothetical protein